MRSRRCVTVIIAATCFCLGLIGGQLWRIVPSGDLPDHETRDSGGHATGFATYPFTIFDAEPPDMNIPRLQSMVDGARTDAEAIARVLAFFEQNRSRLQESWQEGHRDRLKALFAMYVIHISHTYGPTEPAGTFLQHVKERTTAHCGLYGIFQSRLLDAFGLDWRYVAVSSGEHGWIEAKIDGTWEIFDATVNVWIDRSAFDLLRAAPRRYRCFYTPWSDISRPDARAVVAGRNEPVNYTPGTLRAKMIGLGIYYLTPAELRERGIRVEVWPDFSPPG